MGGVKCVIASRLIGSDCRLQTVQKINAHYKAKIRLMWFLWKYFTLHNIFTLFCNWAKYYVSRSSEDNLKLGHSFFTALTFFWTVWWLMSLLQYTNHHILSSFEYDESKDNED